MKKRIFIYVFLICFSFANAQFFRPYVGAGAYLHTDFEKSAFLSLRTGGEFNLSKYVKPEIEISGLIGSLEIRSVLNDNNIVISEYTRTASAINYSICPKIILGNDLDSYFVLLPRYSISNIEANKKSYVYNNAGSQISDKRENVKVWDQSFSFGIGYNFNLSAENPDSLCIILDLQGVEMGKALNEISESKSRVTTKWTFGLGLNYYFNLKKKKT